MFAAGILVAPIKLSHVKISDVNYIISSIVIPKLTSLFTARLVRWDHKILYWKYILVQKFL